MKAKTNPSRPRKPGRRTRRSYHRPKLTTYGDVRRLTDAVDTAGMADGGGGYNTKT